MIDYKTLYFQLFHATEEAIQILIKAQQDCEALYLSQSDDETDPTDPI